MLPVATTAGGMCLAIPDVCIVPGSPPTPMTFPNVAMCADAVQTSTAITADGKPVLVVSSRIPRSTGDEPGSLGGIMSGVFMGPCTFRTGSSKVIAGGKRVVMKTSVTAQNGDPPNAFGHVVNCTQNKVKTSG